jgi:hypothetical protein
MTLNCYQELQNPKGALIVYVTFLKIPTPFQGVEYAITLMTPSASQQWMSHIL